MTETRNHIEYVIGSSVRADILHALAGDAETVAELRETVEASESAIYSAVNDLEGRGLVASTDGTLSLTGSGQLTTDALDRFSAVETLVDTDVEYWETHDIDALPDRFRDRLPQLAGCEVRRATAADPHRVVRTVARHIEEASTPDIVAPVYGEEYASALSSCSSVRLLVDEVVTEQVAEVDAVEAPPNTTVRVGHVSFALAVTEDALLLSLPDLQGDYDSRTEVIAEHDRARAWGRRLFEHCWAEATPIER